ncbi:4'-phosphopantetheinyl transferase family protein [Bergeyella sp. RCAD1439]|uniref:4'-phosphopantetheinyl transferase family protein n=1 Tax=Bergeyella anatis TaxID=3113737 RepID=UPI002E195B22|nr:4'-phosphopantetheinyl transferase superfamily protein [Bergeyella sp. RCAD1439]
MPLHQKIETAHTTILFWEYDAGESALDEGLVYPDEREKIEAYAPKKKAEFLMVRRMLRLLKPGCRILYRGLGQPYLWPKEAFVSITHSFPLAALAVSEKRVGIDLERVSPKVLNVKSKFLHASEQNWLGSECEAEYLTVIWVIKEALYKLHPSKYWSLKKHYRVEPFDLAHLSAVKCAVFDDTFQDDYVACVRRVGDFYFAVIEENHCLNYVLETAVSSE